MRGIVAYNSRHGNTEKVAQAVAKALTGAFDSHDEVSAHRVTEMETQHLGDLGLLVVGAPTHGFRPSQATKTFLDTIPAAGLDGVKVAAFDTRFAVKNMNSAILRFLVRLFGYAAKPIADEMSQKGGDLVLPPEGFIVMDTEGPLAEGELDRAAEWGREIADRVR